VDLSTEQGVVLVRELTQWICDGHEVFREHTQFSHAKKLVGKSVERLTLSTRFTVRQGAENYECIES
jgi:hypothetical protein